PWRARRGRAGDGVGAGTVARAAREAVRVPQGIPGLLQQPRRRHGPARGGVHAAPGRRVRAVQGPGGAVGDAPVGARRAAGAPRPAPPPPPPARRRRGGRLRAVRRRAAGRAPGVPGALPPLPRGGRRAPRPGQALLQPAGRAGERVQVRGPTGGQGGGEGGGRGAGCRREARREREAGGERRGAPHPDHQEQAPPRADVHVLQGDARQARRGGPAPTRGGDPAGDRALPRRAGQVLQP
ncbi:hypothetical protein ACJX0J_029181, partial [Zea mays]